jgi:hypothetical protein
MFDSSQHAGSAENIFCRGKSRVKAIVSSDGLSWKCYQWIDDKFLVSPEQIFC